MEVNSGLGISIGSYFIAYYGMMIVIGLVAATAVGWYQVKKHGGNFDDFILIAAVGGLCGIFGAKLMYLIVSFDTIDFAKITELQYLSDILSGGFVFYGGLAGGLVGLLVCKKFLHLEVYSMISIAIPCLPIAHGFGRLGCSLVGCCYGKPYEGWGAIVYQNSLFAPNHQFLFPIQAVEAVSNFAIAILLLVFINRYSSKQGVKLYLIMYAVVRMILEFFRYDNSERGLFLGISTSQYISIAIILIIAFDYYLQKKRMKQKFFT